MWQDLQEIGQPTIARLDLLSLFRFLYCPRLYPLLLAELIEAGPQTAKE